MVDYFLCYYWEGCILFGYEKNVVEYYVNFIFELFVLKVMIFDEIKLVIFMDKII